MRTKSNFFYGKARTFIFMTSVISLSSAQSIKTIEYVRTARFGNEIVYYGENNEVLNGTFKIAERSGSYSEASFIDGRPEGRFKFYDSFGNLESFTTYENGTGNGKGESYGQKGNVLNTYAYKNGKEHGEWIYRNHNGIYQIENYEEGKKTGKWEHITRGGNGAVQATTTEFYVEGEPTGTWVKKDGDSNILFKKVYTAPKTYSEVEYFETGKIMSYKNFENGQRHGKQELYYDNGFKKEEYEYENGIMVMEKKYHNNGILAIFGRYTSNGPDGVHQTFNQEGAKTRQKAYNDGTENGLDISYHSQSGNKWVERNYKDGIEDGIYKEYYSDGDLYLEGQKKKGQREGTWKYYDRSNKLIKEERYTSNNKISETNYN